MLSRCANPDCGKPLHYLREGKVFLFEVPSSKTNGVSQREHFWLCGECSQAFSMTQVANEAASLVALPAPARRKTALSSSQPLKVAAAAAS